MTQTQPISSKAIIIFWVMWVGLMICSYFTGYKIAENQRVLKQGFVTMELDGKDPVFLVEGVTYYFSVGEKYVGIYYDSLCEFPLVQELSHGYEDSLMNTYINPLWADSVLTLRGPFDTLLMSTPVDSATFEKTKRLAEQWQETMKNSNKLKGVMQ